MPENRNDHISFDHVGLTVPDLEAAVSFFTEHFGARIVFHLPRFEDPTGDAVARLGATRGASFSLTMLELGSGQVELLEWDPLLTANRRPNERSTFPPNLLNAAHLAVSVADVEETLERFRTVQGVVLLSDPLTFEDGPTPGLTNAFITTPWGLLIELMEWPE